MGRIIKGHYKRRFMPTSYPIPSDRYAQEKIEWEQAICSVCLEAPHNAVLLLCSSHEKGCRPYMCGTNFRHSDCLNLFKKAYAKPSVTGSHNPQEHVPNFLPFRKKSEPSELSCPLCRGQVKGWTVVEPARRYLNRKKRTCMHDGCSFLGKFKELKKHVRDEHRLAKARQVDPVLEAKWRALELQREEQDVFSTIRSSMPRSMVMGDYVIDMDGGSSDIVDFDPDDDDLLDDDDDDDLLDIVDFDPDDDDLLDDDDDDDGRDAGFLSGRMGSGRGLNQRILFYLFHHGARVSRVWRDNATGDGGGNGGGRRRRRQGRTLWT